jgi:hypothetical protein
MTNKELVGCFCWWHKGERWFVSSLVLVEVLLVFSSFYAVSNLMMATTMSLLIPSFCIWFVNSMFFRMVCKA